MDRVTWSIPDCAIVSQPSEGLGIQDSKCGVAETSGPEAETPMFEITGC